MATVIEFRNGKRTEHTEDEAALDAEWRILEIQAQLAATQLALGEWAWLEMLKAMSAVMEAQTMIMTDMKRVAKRGEVIHAADRFRTSPMATERRIETRRYSGTRVPVAKRRHDEDGDLPPSAA